MDLITRIEHHSEDKINKIYFIIYSLYALFFTSFMMYTSYHLMKLFEGVINTTKPKLNELECLIGIILKELNITKCI